MLFEEFLKEYRNIEQLEKQIEALTGGAGESERTA